MQIRKYLALLGASGTLLLVYNAFHVWRTYPLIKAPQEAFIERIAQDVAQGSSLTGGSRIEDAPAGIEKPRDTSVDRTGFFLERPLPAAFKDALEKYPVVPISDVKVVLIVTYYRCGSSFFGELMSSTPRTFFHYEPLMLFTVSGGIRPGRQYHAFQLLDGLLRCRFEPLYTAWMESTRHYKHNQFLTEVCRGGDSCFSPAHLSALCSRALTQVFKFTRLRVTQVQSWIHQNPEIAESVRVVHLVRDPRAIYSSRKSIGWCMEYKHCGTPSALCDQMTKDLDAFTELTSKLPQDRVHQIRFEDLAADPMNETKRLFSRLGLDFAPSVSAYIEKHTMATGKETRYPYSTLRNSKTVVDRWKRKLSTRLIKKVEDACSNVLHRLGYKPLYRSDQNAQGMTH
ncbi:hypothetical protein HPB50_000995 [Hyalomma asiaticum]|uniref:Uncharacterized protein n=1 Tax=Hyalomma asiaticum TaxID=266040 RepID=A0ACB7SSE4_HYAAI|nr:hypothetical protein HPB50_000995 [Hyalomma asiaticum]